MKRDVLAKILPTLSRSDLDVLLRNILAVDPASELTGSTILKAGFYEWVNHLGLLNIRKSSLLLEVGVGRVIDEFFEGGKRRRLYFTLADSRYAFWNLSREVGEVTGLVYDCHYEKWVDALPDDTVTHITCDLSALYRRLLRLAKTFTGDSPCPRTSENVTSTSPSS